MPENATANARPRARADAASNGEQRRKRATGPERIDKRARHEESLSDRQRKRARPGQNADTALPRHLLSLPVAGSQRLPLDRAAAYSQGAHRCSLPLPARWARAARRQAPRRREPGPRRRPGVNPDPAEGEGRVVDPHRSRIAFIPPLGRLREQTGLSHAPHASQSYECAAIRLVYR